MEHVSTIAAVAQRTCQILRHVGELSAQGWRRTEQDFAITMSYSAEGSASEVAQRVSILDGLVTDATLTCRWGTLELQVRFLPSAGFVVEAAVDADLRATFDGDELAKARDAFGGSVEAALALTGSWDVEIELDPAALLTRADQARRWHVVRDQEQLFAILARRPWWTVRSLVDPGTPVVVLTVDEEAPFSTATVTVTGVRQLEQALALSEPPASTTPSEQAPPGIASPLSLAPSDDPPNPDLAALLWRYAGATAWACLATDVDTPSSGLARLEFFGYQRLAMTLGGNGPEVGLSACRDVVDLWRWACLDAGPDRLLAVRQVISLYRGDTLWSSAGDVRRAAEPVFLALRSDAVSEAFRARREAHSTAISVAHQTSETTASLAKGTVERSLATFGGVVGLVLVRSTGVVDVGAVSALLAVVAVYLGSLALWSVFVEGPPVTAAITALNRDLVDLSELLTEPERKRILELQTVRGARRHAWIARVAVPIAYAAAAVIVGIVLR